MAKDAKPETVGDKGRFIGIVGTGKERYQIHLIETLGEKVVRREILHAGRTELVQGRMTTGDGLAVTRANFNASVAKKLLDISDLWKK